ncbi:MAG: EAL domain-containing response regulator [Actinomycetota bacterium]
MSNTLLVIDDDPAICELLADLATQLGYQVNVASTPSEIDRLIETPHDVVMLDLSLGETDGMRVMRTLGSHHPGTRLVLLTGANVSVLSGARRVAEMSGFDVLGAFAKPAPIDLIEGVLRSATEPLERRTRGHDSGLTEVVLDALDLGQMHLLYQPLLRCSTGRITGAEALVRLDVKGMENLSPATWVPIIEEAERTGDLLDLVFRRAAHDRLAAPGVGALENVSLNLSLLDLADLSLPERAEMMLGKAAPPTAWTLELTETAELGELASALDVLVRLRLKGFSLAMDDFGTGSSTLERLREMPFTGVKADRRFVRTEFNDFEHASSMLRAAVELGAALGIRVVAEGIETMDEFEMACQVGCDFAQGYYIGRPVRAESFGVLVASWDLSRPQVEPRPR